MKLQNKLVTLYKPHLPKSGKCWIAVGKSVLEVDDTFATAELITAHSTKKEADDKAKTK